MRSFSSNKEFFEFISNAAERIESEGDSYIAAQVRGSLKCFNGLTDGWYLFIEQIQSILSQSGRRLSSASEADLSTALKTAEKVVQGRAT